MPDRGICHCAVCGYDVSGVGRIAGCPECGHTLDGADRYVRSSRARVLSLLALIFAFMLPPIGLALAVAALVYADRAEQIARSADDQASRKRASEAGWCAVLAVTLSIATFAVLGLSLVVAFARALEALA